MNSNADRPIINNILNVLSTEYLDKRQRARETFVDFITFVKPKYSMTQFHRSMGTALDDFSKGLHTRQMLFAPPQHGKSEQSSRLLPAFELGKNPSLKIALVCYSPLIAEGFSKDIQKIIESDEYRELFPGVIIDGVGCKQGTLKRNAYEFHTSENGYLISVGVGGPLTSKTVDLAIIDDLYKSHIDAWSASHRAKVQNWYWTVLESRLHNDSRVLILYTRWHEKDLAGDLIQRESSKWFQLKFEQLKTIATIDNNMDNRAIGEALWPEKHSVEKALRWKEMDPIGFAALGQQDPKPKEGLMYPKHNTYAELPDFNKLGLYHIRKAQVDTADTGSDFLSSVCYIECNGLCYILDIYYTQDAMEITEEEVANRFIANKVTFGTIESNNGGRGFARQVIRHLNNKSSDCFVDWFSQSINKEAKIFANASKVMNRILFPFDWQYRWPEAYDSFTRYTRQGRNEHDDLQDCLSEIVMRIETGDVALEESGSQGIIIA